MYLIFHLFSYICFTDVSNSLKMIEIDQNMPVFCWILCKTKFNISALVCFIV